jgi:predicted nucleotidyltransferase
VPIVLSPLFCHSIRSGGLQSAEGGEIDRWGWICDTLGGVSIQITIPRDEIVAFCRRNRIRRLSLFGSVLRDDFGPDSDVDALVEFEPDARISLFSMAAMEIELTGLIGHKVDLRTPEELSRYFRQRVIETAERLYERA